MYNIHNDSVYIQFSFITSVLLHLLQKQTEETALAVTVACKHTLVHTHVHNFVCALCCVVLCCVVHGPI